MRGERDTERHDELARIVEAMRAADLYRPDPGRAPVVLSLPFRGTWLARNTPARRVPSHGTHLLGQTYAIDFTAVDERRRTSAVRDWRTLLAAEPAQRFYAFGAPILAPAAGRVVAAHDGEPDHLARRSPATALPYLLTQGARLRQGLDAIVGNHLILELDQDGPYVAMAHLRAGSLRVRPGDQVTLGQEVAQCGNSGNSTQPHVHIQVMDSPDLLTGRGLPMAFRGYRAWRHGTDQHRDVTQGVPDHRETVETLPR
ncbi:M23 family metallopeptidase [Antribacter sp. KLBMP9083]|uniref:M23 family metallopeptidase n=1 Tax=Antribacter soli TaxID=2910976 RepID=A0AA41QEU2_9MICO|nr:M23 family metallopeptidase [Antribacter soli]MCF4120789.1 M23 family metallopeptidase [Antribacter soli]